MNKVNNIIRIPASLSGSFFKYWFKFLKPFHNLTDRQIDVISEFVKERYELSKVIKDDTILDKVVMSEETKRKIRENCNMSNAHFQVAMSELRKHSVIVDNKIQPKYIPKIVEGDGYFQLLLLFELK